VATFVDLADDEAKRHKPSVIFVDGKNRVTERK